MNQDYSDVKIPFESLIVPQKVEKLVMKVEESTESMASPKAEKREVKFRQTVRDREERR